MSLGFNPPNMAQFGGCLPSPGLPLTDTRHPCHHPGVAPGLPGMTLLPPGSWPGQHHHLLFPPTPPAVSTSAAGAPGASRLHNGGGEGGGQLSPTALGEMMNHSVHSAALANRVHSLLTMADPNLDSRGTEILENWRQFQQAAIAHNLDPNMLAMYHSASFDPNGSQRRKNATRETTSTLKAWLNEHRKNPYPTKGEKIMLAIITKMTLTQVSTWFANARRRLKKENKMTWTPRNRAEEDKEGEGGAEGEGEEDDGEDDDIDCEVDDDVIMDADTGDDLDLDCSSGRDSGKEGGPVDEKPDYPSPPVKPVQPKIWSIMETLAKKDDVKSPPSGFSPLDLQQQKQQSQKQQSPSSFSGMAGPPPGSFLQAPFIAAGGVGGLFPMVHHFLPHHHVGPAASMFPSLQQQQQQHLSGMPLAAQFGHPSAVGLVSAAARAGVDPRNRFPGFSLPFYTSSAAAEAQEQLLKFHNNRKLIDAPSSKLPSNTIGSP